ncbi:MAG TPA: hypothetical protein VFZ83_11055 [Acidimicrobiia bacterium]|nr:hypothetical protein [Acidimicrobiia bacterium]
MEDRTTRGLYLEMWSGTPSGYVDARVDALLAQPGVERATWWRNARPNRDDLPRHLPEFDVLGAYEIDDAFRPPTDLDTVDDIVGAHHFRRTARPGQGVLTGAPTIGLSLVLISPRTPEQAQALRDWADFVHIRHIAAAAVPGFGMITPYENVSGGDPRFLHWYEIDRDDPEAVFRSMTPRVEARIGGPDTDAWKAWAFHRALRIMYVNTFALVGARTP